MSAVLRGVRRDRACASRERGRAATLLERAQGRLPGARPRISPDYYCMDGTIPRARLADMLDRDRGDGGEVRPALRATCSTRATATCIR